MQRWEYKQITKIITDRELNELANQGWELVGVTGVGVMASVLYVFKRTL